MALFLVLVFGGIGAYLARDLLRGRDGLRLDLAASAPAGTAVDTVGVLPVENAAGDADAWVRWGLSTVIAETLDRTSGLSVVEPERLAKVLGERGLGVPGADRGRLRELTAALGADLVLDLTFRRDQLGVRLEAKFVAPAGDVLASRVYEAATALTAATPLVREVVGVMVPGYEAMSIEAALSGDPFFDRLYATGVHTFFAGYGQDTAPEQGDDRSESTPPDAQAVALEQAMSYYRMAVRDRPGFLQAQLRRVDGLRRQRRLVEARQITEGLVQTAQAEGAFEVLERLYRELGRLEALAANLAAAEVHLREAHRLALARGDDAARAVTIGEMAQLALASNRPGRAEELLVEMLGIREQRGDRLGRIDVLIRLGSLMLADGDLDGARSLLDRALILAQDLRDPWTAHRAGAGLGEVASRQNKSDQAVEFWSQALRFYSARGDGERTLQLSRQLAETQLARMQWQEAERYYLDVLELAQARDDRRLIADASVHLAWLQLKQGYPFQAEDHLQRALDHDRHLDARDRLQRVIAWVAYEQGNRRLALESQTEILRQCKDKGCWNRADQAFLDVFQLALAEDRRLPVPGEAGGPEFPGW